MKTNLIFYTLIESLFDLNYSFVDLVIVKIVLLKVIF